MGIFYNKIYVLSNVVTTFDVNTSESQQKCVRSQLQLGSTERQVPIFSYFSQHTPIFPIFQQFPPIFPIF